MRCGLQSKFIVFIAAASIAACGGVQTAKNKSGSANLGTTAPSVEQEYDLGTISFSELKIDGLAINEATHVLAMGDAFSLLAKSGKAWQFKTSDKAATKVEAPVASNADLFTLNGDAYWELRADGVERSVKATQDELESQAFVFPEQLSLAGMRILGIDERGIVGLKEGVLYLIHFETSRLYVEKMTLPKDLFADSGANIIAAGLIQDGTTPWLWDAAGIAIKMPNASGWAKVKTTLQGVDAGDTAVGLALQMSFAAEGPQIKSDIVLLSKTKIFKSGALAAVVKTGDHTPAANPDWNIQVKPHFEAACLSCHSNYASAGAWIANKCSIISRISIEKKGATTTMPPTFAAPAQLDAMNANDNENRLKMLAWLGLQPGNCN